MNKKTYFTKPNIYATFEPASDGIKKGFSTRIIPYKYFKFTGYSLFILFLSPMALVLMNLDFMKDEKVFYPIFWTLCITFVLYAILTGVVLIIYKNPYMQELKDKLGYTEK